MPAIKLLSLFLALMLSACASKPTLVASSCPPHPPIPDALKVNDVSTGANLMQRLGAILKERQEALNELSDSLSRAQR